MKSLICASVVLLALASLGSMNAAPVYLCQKVAVPPTIDGVLDDSAWQVAKAVTLVSTITGLPVLRSTVVRICWDDTHLYLAYDCAGSDIWGTVTQHDGPIYLQEVAEVFLDPDCDGKTYTEIDVSPRNVVFDAQFDPDKGAPLGSRTAQEWTCSGLKTAVTVDGTLDNRNDTDRGWRVEMAIPFASIGVPVPKPGQVWRANLYRYSSRPRPAELQAWSPTYNRNQAFHVLERFGQIVFTDTSMSARTNLLTIKDQGLKK